MMFRKLACSFCGRDESQVAKLVAGPRVYICDRCAYETVRIMETTPVDPPGAPQSGLWRRAIRAWHSMRSPRFSDVRV
jgi:hypothetical protein